MAKTGGCRCGEIRYEVEGEPKHSSLCHCADCRASSGAPAMAWTAFELTQFRLRSGEPRSFTGPGGAIRQFCGNCGTGLFYHNESMLPGIIDIQAATFDQQVERPTAQIQCADRLEWMTHLHTLPQFAKYPPG